MDREAARAGCAHDDMGMYLRSDIEELVASRAAAFDRAEVAEVVVGRLTKELAQAETLLRELVGVAQDIAQGRFSVYPRWMHEETVNRARAFLAREDQK